jgi:type I restriction enzyme R subunit
MEWVVNDIVFDFSIRPRLSSDRGNALLVTSSIRDACKYYTLFQKTSFKGKCALVTSYNPQAQDLTKEETGANTETDKQFIYNTYTEMLKDVKAESGMTKSETYEEKAKTLFIKEPANMKLLIVVDKLLLGFDAPPCTYLYIDKSMQDHGLFQAICRTNRLDGEDKDFGYIVDYKDLIRKLENTIAVYTSELDNSVGGSDPQVLLKDRLKMGRERLETMRWKRLPCSASLWSRPKGIWSIFTTSVATPRIRPICRNGRCYVLLSTKRPSLWCALTPTSPTNWKLRDTAATISIASSSRSNTT